MVLLKIYLAFSNSFDVVLLEIEDFKRERSIKSEKLIKGANGYDKITRYFFRRTGAGNI